MTKTLLSLGHGYTAQALATRLLPQGWTILGTFRDPAQEAVLRAQGITPLQWPIDFESALKDVTHVLTSIRPDKDGDPVLRLAKDALQAAAPNLEWLGYL
ncbi:MAG: SDR family NAD(P)-dependent oxidoreductase, partial [Pseudomonadota bacterium]|nr:SDR family NAD(P)-dependent oxidoreductase [Pseudomonadota bacterium]